MIQSAWIPRGALVALLPLLAVGCSESDSQLFDDIGVGRLSHVDPGLGAQSVVNPGRSAQAVTWTVSSAILEVDDTLVEIAPGGDCELIDTAAVPGLAFGQCANGLVLDTSGDEIELRLTLEVSSMTLSRGEPLDLALSVDFDGDGVPNDGDQSGSAFDNPCGLNGQAFNCDDNCPLISNSDQADANADGVGNGCTVFDFVAGFLRDSDSDGLPDGSDNCVWVANPDQADTFGPREGIPDLIGDACEQQDAVVQVGGNTSFQLQLGPFFTDLPVDLISLITVDFDSEEILDCNWEAGTCVMQPDLVELCTHTSGTLAQFGCFL